MKKIGKLFLALGTIAVFAGCKTSPEELTLTKIEVTTPADKVEYLVGEDLDTTGLEITATYSDESSKVVTGWTPSGFDKTKAGEQSVKITYTENEITVETSYTVTVKEVPVKPEDPGKDPVKVELTKIEVTTPADKVEYLVGEDLDTTGLEITATYSDESSKVVTGWTPSGFDKTKAGEQSVKITYTENEITVETSYTVTVKAIELTKIEITNQPTKKEYFVGAAQLDLTGLKVTATYNDGTTKDVTANVITSGFNSSTAVESQIITVTYEGKTATFTVKINPILLTGIAVITQPTKKDYHIGDTLDTTGMVVTANYNDGSSKALTSNEYTVTGFDSTECEDNQVITVTHNEKTATFTINVVFNWYEIPELLPAGTPGTYGTDGIYVYFGVWPQDVVPVGDVATLGIETSTVKVTRGYMEYVKGSDGNYYVKCAENAYESGYKYKKDNSDVGQGGTTSRWFKVMPITWRVVETAYDVDGDTGSETATLLVAENILTAKVPYYESDSERTISDSTVYANNYMHSQIRAYLNGINYNAANESDESNWLDKGFLQTAFTSDAIDSIITTKVDNAREQMSYDGTNDMEEDYACGPTDDKIFLLSEREVVQYSNEAYDSSDNSRIRVTTDFAKANNAYQNEIGGYGGFWWLRSPGYSTSCYARSVYYDGKADIDIVPVSFTSSGVVPALAISF